MFERGIRFVLAPLAITVLSLSAGCQSPLDDTANASKSVDIKPPPSQVQEAFGTKGAEITLMLPKGASGVREGRYRDFHDGAQLAVGELGGEQVFVKIVDDTGAPGEAAKLAEAAKARGSVALVGLFPAAELASISAVPADKRPTVFDLGRGTASGANVYGLASDETDSAIAGVRYAIATGRKKVVILAPASFSTAEEQRITAAITNDKATVTGVVRYGGDEAAIKAAVASNAGPISAADAALVLGGTTAPAVVVGAIKATGKTPATMTFVGTSGWPGSVYSGPAADQTVIALTDQESLKLISGRYQSRFKRPLALDAAYAYDAVATVAGITRLKGPDGLKPDILANKAGFRGVTGVFGWNKGGTIDRKLKIYRVDQGKLVPAVNTPPTL
ncbi:ABC transporter substrate-binding protein [Sinorhizobium sp. BG8]|uniref:ABC transporter substrate-binding protein n=1 Tax=Sinorhizobium sp. BG8 TaxID=2613773 RepID=UPI00193E3E3E|nr:ABC transporter substrate-binding protein [Sinorhizobium sp. BG8]